MEISNIRLLDTDFTEEFSTIIRKVDWEIWLDYDDEMSDEEFEMAKQHIQSLIDILAHTVSFKINPIVLLVLKVLRTTRENSETRDFSETFWYILEDLLVVCLPTVMQPISVLVTKQ